MSGNITYKKFKLDAGMSYKKMKSPNMPVVDYGGGNILYNMLIWGGTEYDIRDFKNYWKFPDQQQNAPEFPPRRHFSSPCPARPAFH